MSKFKVGDKVRVTENICGYEKGYVGIITRDDNDGTYQLDKNRYWIGYPRLETVTPLTFDHSLALQGSPVYCNGQRIYPLFKPEYQYFYTPSDYISRTHSGIGGTHIPEYRWYANGNTIDHYSKGHPLTTIPPIEYVEESRWIWVSEKCAKTKEAALDLGLQDTHQLCEVKIKVKKP